MATAERSAAADREPAAWDSRSGHPAPDRPHEQVRGATHDTQELGGPAKDAVQVQIGHLGEAASAVYAQGRDRVRRAERGVQDYIREQPIACVLAAAGAGALAGVVGSMLGRLWIRR